MARMAGIDFRFGEAVDVAALFAGLASGGATFVLNGRVSYLIDPTGMFDWSQADGAMLEDLLARLAGAANGPATLGLSVYLDETPHGGDLLVHPDRRVISFSPEVNRRTLPGGSSFCDFGWYLERLVPVLEPRGLVAIDASDLP